MTFCEKIRNILKYNEFKITSASKLEEYCNLGRSSITAHYTKEGKPCVDTAPGLMVQAEIQEKMRINKEWWETGEGEIFLPQKEESETINEPEIKQNNHTTDLNLLFIDTIKLLIEKNDKLVQDKNVEIIHLRGNENWFKEEFSKLTAKLGPPNDV